MLSWVWLFGSPSGSSVHGLSQARILEWDAISSSGDLPNLGIEQMSPALPGRFFTTEPPGKVKSLSHVQLYVTPWTEEPTRLLCPWDFPGKTTGVGRQYLLRVNSATLTIFPRYPFLAWFQVRVTHKKKSVCNFEGKGKEVAIIFLKSVQGHHALLYLLVFSR